MFSVDESSLKANELTLLCQIPFIWLFSFQLKKMSKYLEYIGSMSNYKRSFVFWGCNLPQCFKAGGHKGAVYLQSDIYVLQ